MYRQILDILSPAGKRLIVHYDGKLRVIADDIAQLDLDIDSLTPAPEDRGFKMGQSSFRKGFFWPTLLLPFLLLGHGARGRERGPTCFATAILRTWQRPSRSGGPKVVGDLEHGAGPLWRAVPENRRGHAESRAGRDLGPFVRLCRHARQSLSARILGERRRTEVCRGCFPRTCPGSSARRTDKTFRCCKSGGPTLGIVLRRTLECRGHDRRSACRGDQCAIGCLARGIPAEEEGFRLSRPHTRCRVRSSGPDGDDVVLPCGHLWHRRRPGRRPAG